MYANTYGLCENSAFEIIRTPMKNNNRTALLFSVILLTSVLSGAASILPVFTTTPQELGPGGVTMWFIALFVFLSSSGACIAHFLQMRKPAKREHAHKSLLQGLRISVLISTGVVVLLALKSLGSLNLRDVILFLLTLVIIELYFRTKRSQNL